MEQDVAEGVVDGLDRLHEVLAVGEVGVRRVGDNGIADLVGQHRGIGKWLHGDGILNSEFTMTQTRKVKRSGW